MRDFVNFAWDHLGGSIRWEGEGVDEKGYDEESGKLICAVDPRHFRGKAKEKLGWIPRISLKDMVQEMMESDLNLAKRDALVAEHKYRAFDYHE